MLSATAHHPITKASTLRLARSYEAIISPVYLQIGFAAIILAAIAAVLALGKPVVDYTFSVFPTGAASQEGLYSP